MGSFPTLAASKYHEPETGSVRCRENINCVYRYDVVSPIRVLSGDFLALDNIDESFSGSKS